MEQLTLDQQRIVSENHNLIYSLANKKNINLDEYYDVLAIGLCKAAIAFDNTKGKFSTLAYTVMLNEYKQELRKQQNERAIPQDKLLSFDVPIQTDQDSQFASFADVIPDNNVQVEQEAIVTKTKTVNGKTQTYTEVETYWTWDEINRDHVHVSTITFLDSEFPYGTINYFPEHYIDTLDAGYHLRDVYYGSALSYEGTLYANLADNTIAETSFYCEKTIDETIEYLETEWQLVLFWIFWIALTGFAVYGFYYIDNRWLE